VHREKLLNDLKQQVKALEADLLERAGEPEFHGTLRAEYDTARTAERIAVPYETWLDNQVTQAAVAWVLGTVFLRFCEDNRLIEYPYLAAPDEDRREIPVDRQHEFYGKNPGRDTDRDWILEGFAEMSRNSKVAAGLFDEAHNPMWRIAPSHHAAKELVKFWRLRGEDGELAHDFTDGEWNTRFLGDLYQDLSEAARKNYALLQTPEFVEEFILDLTLAPAIDEFGLEPEKKAKHVSKDTPNVLRVIDPTCGSGHFLLGAFNRLLTAWVDRAPGAEPWELISKVLAGVHGVDKNPFAVSIARFRLFLAAMKAADSKTLKEAPEFPINIAIGDSLLHGRGTWATQQDLLQQIQHTFRTEDIHDQKYKEVDLLGSDSYHVVVGNPPYITVSDKNENNSYRERYISCYREYSLAAPFAERFFRLGIRGAHDQSNSGHIGQITTNAFMKREWGKKLVEEFFKNKAHLTHIVDTSGIQISDHGTPTVILIGRNSFPRKDVPILAVLGIKGESRKPVNPAEGSVWKAIQEQIYKPGSVSEWVSVEHVDRQKFSSHPWSLTGGGASDVMATLHSNSARELSQLTEAVGSVCTTGEDEFYLLPRNGAGTRLNIESSHPILEGDAVRDYVAVPASDVIWTYNESNEVMSERDLKDSIRVLQKYRTTLSHRKRFGIPMTETHLPWYSIREFYSSRVQTNLAITFAFLATHNHFALNRGKNMFHYSALVVKLPNNATEEEYQKLLALLNSSTTCFWLKQVCHNKGGGGIGGGIASEDWERFFEFTGPKLQRLPLPLALPSMVGQLMDSLATGLAATEPSTIAARSVPTRADLDKSRNLNEEIQQQMIATQEELDWEVYGLYGLLDETNRDTLTSAPDTVPKVKLGERAFEIVMARRVETGEVSTEWFSRHGSAPITEIPSHWPIAYQELVQRRIECIESHKDIALIERPECKRRWATTPWEVREQVALRDWLLNACERREFWFALDHSGVEQPQILTINQLADKIRADADVLSVSELFAPDTDLAKVLADIIGTEHVPFLAPLRYSASGLRKRKQWEDTWDLQREEDLTGQRLPISVPPKYGSGDFRKTSYWNQRGKLDVARERFISYPGAGPDTDSSLLLGWAGWDHRQAAHALTMLIHNRAEDGWGPGRLTPLLAGLAEQLPWVRQWHSDVDPDLGASPADVYAEFLADQQERFELSDSDLADWRPAATTRRKKQP
jgi:hypothetical protein